MLNHFLLFVFGLILDLHKNFKHFIFEVFTCNQAEIEGLVDLYLLLNMKDKFIYMIAFNRFGHCIMLIIKFNET